MIPISETSPPQSKVYRCGSLTYTRRHLAILFFWLLWGDFCYQLMETVTPSIMPLKLNSLGASNFTIGLISGTIPSLIYSFFNPIISFKSDRFRSRFGRRIPFILFSLPFLVFFLICLGFGDRIGHGIHALLGTSLGNIAPNTVALWSIGMLLVVFTFFNTFVTSTFWYLFNDVVPDHLLARFMSWFRMVSMISTAFYQFCIFRYANTHAAEILTGAALIYLVGFGLMCLNVREGSYPPPPPYLDGKSGPWAAVKTYTGECLSIRHYWYQWLGTIIGSIGTGVGSFTVFMFLAVGLSMKQIGDINGFTNLFVSLLVLGTGWLADRFHPLRVVMAGSIFAICLTFPISLIWFVWQPTPNVAYWAALAIALGLTAPMQALMAMSDPPLLMRVFPRERYGQFCAMNGLCRALGTIIGGGLAGAFLDFMGGIVGTQRAYFLIPAWNLFFAVPSLFCLILLYKSWKRYGGDATYVPPMVGVDGKEISQPVAQG